MARTLTNLRIKCVELLNLLMRNSGRGGVGFILKPLQSEQSSVRHVFSLKIIMYYFSPKRLHPEQSLVRKFTSLLRQVFSQNLKKMSSVRIWKALRQSVRLLARRQSEFKKHVVSPNCKNASSVRIWKASRQYFGLKTCFLNSEWRCALFFSDWRRAFKIRTVEVFSTFGLTNLKMK